MKRPRAPKLARPSDDARRLRAVLTQLNRRIRSERPEAPLGMSALSVLGRLYRDGALSAGELAGLERLQPQSLTRILASLEERGLMQRTADPNDRRRAELSITSAGETLLLRDVAAREAWLARAIAAEFSPVERAVLRSAIELLDRLASC